MTDRSDGTPNWKRLSELAAEAHAFQRAGTLTPEQFQTLFSQGQEAASGFKDALETLLPFAPRGWRPPRGALPNHRPALLMFVGVCVVGAVRLWAVVYGTSGSPAHNAQAEVQSIQLKQAVCQDWRQSLEEGKPQLDLNPQQLDALCDPK